MAMNSTENKRFFISYQHSLGAGNTEMETNASNVDTDVIRMWETIISENLKSKYDITSGVIIMNIIKLPIA